MSAHTPGPWHAVNPEGAFDAKFVIVSEHRDDAIVASIGGDMPEEDANARLIAAAPDLLAFVRKIAGIRTCNNEPSGCRDDSGPLCQAHDLYQMDDEVAEARVLIAKAEGR